MNLNNLISLYVNEGYNIADAISKVAQDVILIKISKSSLKHNITIKGGVVMHNISNDKRRATRDIDFDFIQYSLDDNSIIEFINKLNKVKDEVTIKIKGTIEKLHHQDYDGKRIYITLTDKDNYIIETKLDIGVHKNFDIIQEEYCFNFNAINESVTLFINSKEQIFTEKLKSLLKFSFASTRYKDIFDFYYLIKYEKLKRNKIKKFINKMIFLDEYILVNSYDDIYIRMNTILNNKRFKSNLSNVKINWLEASLDDVINTVLDYISSYNKISIKQ